MKRVSKDFLLFLLPTLIVSGAILVYPLTTALKMSFYSYYLPDPPPRFVGLQQFAEIIQEDIFWKALKNTAILVAISVPLQLVLGLGAALLLNKKVKGQKIFRTVIILPMAISPVVAGLLMRWLFMPEWGLVNYCLSLIRIKGPAWISDPFYGLWSIIFADTWQFTPLVILVLFAGLQSVPHEIIEAAKIDGASALKTVWYIIVPTLKPLILFIIIMRTMDVLRIFDKVYAMTGGGPGTSTETITFYNYRIGFSLLRIGKASAVGVFTLCFLFALITTFIWLQKERKGEW